jgi:DNA-binding GntR family transcriptional regulator
VLRKDKQKVIESVRDALRGTEEGVQLNMNQSEKPIHNKSDLAQLAYDGIRRMLFHNEIVPGQKISYRELAEKLNVSLTPVIQALNRLKHQGLVHHETNRGYFTAPMSIQEVEEIYELRELIEVSLLPAVLHNLNDACVKQLRRLLIDDKSIPQERYLNQKLLKDREFHLAIASISGRKTQLQMLQYLFDLLYLKYRASLLFVASEKTVGSLHQDLFTALESRDLKRTRQAMKKHFRSIKKHALKALNSIMTEKQHFNLI